jgi:RNA recognition motif-containing protein
MRRERPGGEVPIGTVEEVTGSLPSVDEAMAAMDERQQADRSASSIPCRLFVGSLSWETTSAMLEEAFARFGSVQDATVLQDRSTGRSRGIGFVTMADRRHAAAAIQGLNGAELDGRYIVVSIATERSR